jgi:ferrous iron transport protein A
MVIILNMQGIFMIKLSDLNIKQKAKIVKLNCNQELKQRFYSFGIINGAIIKIEEISLTKNTIALVVDDTNIAIRISEASQIIVEILQEQS